MAKKNGHDTEDNDSEDAKIARFPDARERAEIERRLKAANDRTPALRGEPAVNLPPTVKALCLTLLTMQLVMEFSAPGVADTLVDNLAFFTGRYTGAMDFGWQGVAAPVTHMLLHGGWLHLAINVATLAAFGAGIEKDIGGPKLGLLFFGTGIFGALTHLLIYPDMGAPLIGASGGISGLFGAVLMMAQQRGQMGGWRSLLPFIAVWVLISLFFGFFGMPGAEGPIAWTAHVGGFIAGILLYRPLTGSRIFR